MIDSSAVDTVYDMQTHPVSSELLPIGHVALSGTCEELL